MQYPEYLPYLGLFALYVRTIKSDLQFLKEIVLMFSIFKNISEHISPLPSLHLVIRKIKS